MTEEVPLFVQQMDMIRQCLECDKIHDANRTLLSQIVEEYFSLIGEDNVVSILFRLFTCIYLLTRHTFSYSKF